LFFGHALSIPVSLTVKRTEVDYVTPYVAYAGTSRSVVISGAEFSQVTISGVQFGTTPAQSFSVIGPNQIRATYPATLTPVRYPVMLQSNATNIKQLAELVVVNAPVYAAAYTSLGSLPASTLAVVLSPDGDRAYTYDQSKQMRTFDLTATPVSGVFPEVGTSIPLAGDPGNQDPHMAITPDGRALFITGGAELIVQPTP
jgi:hypothetical protein